MRFVQTMKRRTNGSVVFQVLRETTYVPLMHFGPTHRCAFSSVPQWGSQVCGETDVAHRGSPFRPVSFLPKLGGKWLLSVPRPAMPPRPGQVIHHVRRMPAREIGISRCPAVPPAFAARGAIA